MSIEEIGVEAKAILREMADRFPDPERPRRFIEALRRLGGKRWTSKVCTPEGIALLREAAEAAKAQGVPQ